MHLGEGAVLLCKGLLLIYAREKMKILLKLGLDQDSQVGDKT
jgi:hypothetical protein